MLESVDIVSRIFSINREDPRSRSSTYPWFFFSFAIADARAESTTPITEMRLSGSRATVAIWAPLSDYIITGHESGKIAKYDVKTGEEVQAVEDEHSALISDIQLSPDGTYFITASKDKTARVSGNRKDCRVVADCDVTRSCGTLKLSRL